MKWYFSITVTLMVWGCSSTDEEREFVRLETLSAEITHEIDREELRNPDPLHADTVLSQITDSIFAIATYYQDAILHTQKVNYTDEFIILSKKINRKRKERQRDYVWEQLRIDSILTVNPQLSLGFRKASFRVRLGYALNVIQGGYCYQTGKFDLVETHHFVTSHRRADTLEGEYALAYVVTDDLWAKVKLSHNSKSIAPETYSQTYQKTEATFIPQDTGTYTLNGYITLQDPITGLQHTVQEQRRIYVKP